MSQPIKFFQGLKENFPPQDPTIGALYCCIDTQETYLCIKSNTFTLYSSALPESAIINSTREKLREWQQSGVWDGSTLTWSFNEDILTITSSSGTSSANIQGINSAYEGAIEPVQGQEIWISPDEAIWNFLIGDKGDKGPDYCLTATDKIQLAEQVIVLMTTTITEGFVLVDNSYLQTSDGLIFIPKESEA